MKPHVGRGGALAAVLVLCAGCGGGDAAAPATSTAPATSAVAGTTVPSPPPSTAAAATTPATTVAAQVEFDPEPLGDLLDESGVLGLDGALAAFAATFADLPGVEPAAGAVHHHATAILATLAAHLYDLPDERRAVVEAVLYESPDAAPRGWRRPRAGRLDEARAIVAEAQAYFAGRLGVGLDRIVMTLVEQPRRDPDTGIEYFPDNAGAAAGPRYSESADGYVYDECVVRINADAGSDTTTFRSEVGHEVFHCFQFLWSSYGHSFPLWVFEGTAAWAGFDFAGPSPHYAEGWWDHWTTRPTRDLYARSYDAIGLFSLAAEHGAPPYTMLPELLSAPDLSQVVAHTGPGLLDAWGTHYANEPGWGAAYTISGPGARADRPARVPLTIGPGVAAFTAVPPVPGRAAQVYEFEVFADVLHVTGPAAGRLRAGDGTEVAMPAGTQDVCVRPDGCECPPDRVTPPHISATDRSFFLGLGPSPEGPPLLSQMALDDWCTEAAPATTVADTTPTAPEECVVGDWVVGSDQVAAYYRALSAESSGVELSATGVMLVSFRADGTYTYTPDITLHLETGGLPGQGTFSGDLHGRYSAAGGVITTHSEVSTLGATVEVNGMTIDGTGILNAVLLVSPVNGAPYECAGERLTIQFATPGGRAPVVLTRP